MGRAARLAAVIILIVALLVAPTLAVPPRTLLPWVHLESIAFELQGMFGLGTCTAWWLGPVDNVPGIEGTYYVSAGHCCLGGVNRTAQDGTLVETVPILATRKTATDCCLGVVLGRPLKRIYPNVSTVAPRKGSTVRIVGYPHGGPLTHYKATYLGVAKDGSYRFHANPRPTFGDSGAAIYDDTNAVVALVSRGDEHEAGIFYGVSWSNVYKFVDAVLGWR